MAVYLNDKTSIYTHLRDFVWSCVKDNYITDNVEVFVDTMVVADELTDELIEKITTYQTEQFVVNFPIKEAFRHGNAVMRWRELLQVIALQQFKFHNSVDRKPVAVMKEEAMQEVDPARIKAMQSVDWQEINRKVCDALLNAKATVIGSYPAEFFDDQADEFNAQMAEMLGLTYTDLGKYTGWPHYIELNHIATWNAFTNHISHAIFEYQIAAHTHTLAATEPEAKPGDAIMRVTYINGETIFQGTDTLSSDLPADALGEIIAGALQTAWQKGDDPMTATIVLTFGKVQ